MVRYLLLLLICFPICVFSQEESGKYIAPGVVPVENGRVLFSKNVNAEGLSESRLYDTMLAWAEKHFITTEEKQGRVLISDKKKGQIICQGVEFITFKRSAWILDRSLVKYRMFIFCLPGEFKLEISGISYNYENENNIPAEKWITDEYALNKDKTKLSYKSGKFRLKTVDLADALFDSAERALKAAK